MNAATRELLPEIDGMLPDIAARLYRDMIRPYLGHRVIDAGAGVGLYSNLISEDNRQVVALESEETFIDPLKARLSGKDEVHLCDLGDQAGLGDFAAADSAICINVMEHVEDHRQLLCNIKAKLDPEGRLVLLVPAHPWLYNRMDAAVGHFRRYRKSEVQALLNETGWKVEDIRYFNSLSIPAWFIAGKVMRVDQPGKSLIRYAHVLMPFLMWADKTFARGKIGISVIAVARAT
jgi:SAM-dependent methyltransferase